MTSDYQSGASAMRDACADHINRCMICLAKYPPGPVRMALVDARDELRLLPLPADPASSEGVDAHARMLDTVVPGSSMGVTYRILVNALEGSERDIEALNAEIATLRRERDDALNQLDAVVHALDIEDSTKTPTERVDELYENIKEINLMSIDLRAEIVTLRAALERISLMSEAYEHDLSSATRYATETLAKLKAPHTMSANEPKRLRGEERRYDL